MRTALQAAASSDWPGALAVAPSGVGRDVIEWQRLRAGEGRLGEYEDFLARRADFPGLPLLREKGEDAVARSDSPDRVVAYFAGQPPRTGAGAVALVGALQRQGRMGEAEDAAMAAWTLLSLTPGEEAALLALAPQSLKLVHEARLDRLLWQGSKVESARMLDRVGADWQALARARMALRAQEDGVTALIAAVPEALKEDAGLAYERFVWRMRADLYDDAMALILERSDSAARLGDPAAWADRRAVLARWLMRQDRPRDAYRVASSHHLGTGPDYADLEFLSGFIALRKLGDAETARRHFGHLLGAVSTPISLARGHYWIGRAEEAAGRAEAAKAAFQQAARHQTAYYGLLAAERLGLSLDPALLSDTAPPDWQGAPFARSPVLQAGLLLLRAGDRTLAKRFILHLAEGLSPAELDQLADMALRLDEPHVAVLVAKAAAERGHIMPRAYFPAPAFVPDGLPVSRALALAISRRESEFDPAARSGADARGLMQVLPSTAKLMADRLGEPFEAGKLFSDPAFNVRMGAAYLAQMVEEFGPSIALVASGYNAGPGRPRRWITEFGDPRQPGTDIVDWVETIPFTETRTYVMRVVEGVVIYRARLKGTAGPVKISAELKG